MFGFVMLLSSKSTQIKYGGTFMAAIGIYSNVPQCTAWNGNNIGGSTKRSVGMAMQVGIGTCQHERKGASLNAHFEHRKPRRYNLCLLVLAQGWPALQTWSWCFNRLLRLRVHPFNLHDHVSES
jgi:hypothetical protein